MGYLPTRDRLGFVVEKMCPVCELETETTLHIFWECHCARALWFSSPFSCVMESVPSFADSVKGRIEWMLSILPSDLTSKFLKFTGCLFDEVWKARNEVLYKSKLINITKVRSSILRKFSESMVAEENGEAGLAVGLLHIRENKVFWYARKDKAESAAEAEMIAILWRLQLAAVKGFKSIAIASDAMVLIRAFHEKRYPPLWKLRPMAVETIWSVMP
ncbi:uncharacterized protein LOC133034142 [Cannabis sativa]|uniref:uncharacterized protein LOC133034142 n=1 Tax=Cannabis sativa TaxID=3483 RepID=UPI0029CAA2BD|nr:uncharacterized protein LOC133034142 [Cannabis sativa]